MSYHPMNLTTPPGPTRLTPHSPKTVSTHGADATAILALTDFRHTPAVSVAADRQIDAALQDMLQAGVRSLLVVRDTAVVGLITSYDIQGEKSLLFIQGPECIHEHCRHQDVQVEDIMTPLSCVPSVRLDTLPESRLGDLLKTFNQHPDWMHLLVIQDGGEDAVTIRGIVSRTQLHRLLGLNGATP